MRTIYRGSIAVALLFTGAQSALAQLDVGGSGLDACGQIESLAKAGNYAGAHDKAKQCMDALDSRLQGEVGKQFPASVAGWMRTNLEQNAALGFTNIAATYTKDMHTAEVSLTGGSGGSGLGGVLGGIARLGLQSGQQVKVAGLPAAVQSDGSIVVTLESGAFLTFKSPDFANQQAALSGIGDLVNAFPVAQINKTLH